jgi:ribosome-binding protein aMBF1 (putative translation factor)
VGADAGGRDVWLGRRVRRVEAEGITRSFVNRLLRLTLLAPDIQEAILDGRQAKGMQLEKLARVMPSEWKEQCRRYLGR